MKRITQLKDEALEALHGNFGKAALATLAFILVYAAFDILLTLGQEQPDYSDLYSSLISGDYSALYDLYGGSPLRYLIGILASMFLFVPFTVGFSNSFRLLYQSKGSDNTLFKNFFRLGFGKSYLHIVWVMLVNTVLVTILTTVAVIIPIILMIIIRNAVATIIGVLLIIFLVFSILLMYSMVTYIVVDNPQLGAIETMRRSRQIMDGNKWKLIVLALSFLGWIILGIFTLGIGYLWLIPYMTTTESAFYCDVRDAEKAA